MSLVGHDVSEKLELIKQIYEMKISNMEEIEMKYPKLFKGLGLMNTEAYVIKIKRDSQPFALSTPRHVPLPLMNKVKQELH